MMDMDDIGIVHTWVVKSYAVHKNIRGQEVGVLLMGRGLLTERSLKQKLNGKSSTKTEVIGIGGIFPHNIWLIFLWYPRLYGKRKSVISGQSECD